MTQKHAIFRTLVYYAIIAGLLLMFDKNQMWSGGPCTPGVGFLVLLILGPLSLLLATVNLIRQFVIKKPAGGAAVIHIAAFLAWLILVKSY